MLDQLLGALVYRTLKLISPHHNTFAIEIMYDRLRVGQRAAKFAARHKVSHVHCHDPLLAYSYWLFSHFYGATKQWGYKMPAFGRYVKPRLGIDIDHRSLKMLQRLENLAEGKAKWIIFTTQSCLDKTLKEMAKRAIPRHWQVIPNPVVVSRSERNKAREKLGIMLDERLLIAVGQLIPLKRFDLLIQSIALISNKENLRVIILGDGEEEARLKRFAKQHAIPHFDIVATDQIGDYYSAADIYVSTSSTEGFGNANCEALLAGLPCICTAVDGIPEQLQDGVLFTKEIPNDIAKAIYSILSSPQKRESLLKKAKAVSSSWKTPEEIARLFEEVLLRQTNPKP
jgi:glycosyltransferase involved in cell wall biosynthesis